MKGPLHLSHIGDNSSSVVVCAQILDGLLPYEIDGIRFLYQQCIIKKHNVILNNDKYMNNARQIAALLTAINKCFPTLIICQNSSIPKWHYEFSKVNLNIVTPNDLIKDDDETSDLPDAVILSHEQLKHIKVLPITEWLFYIIDDIDLVINSRFIKNIQTQFRLAVTSHNFVVDDDDTLQWNILKWANPNLIANKDVFIETNIFNKKHLLYPFPEYWRRITWIIYEKYKPTNEQIKEYDAAVHNWLKSINLKVPVKNSSRKRKLQLSKNRKTRSIKKGKTSSTVTETIKENSNSSETDEEADLLNSFDSKETKIDQKNIKENTSSSETEEETDLLNSFVSKETKIDQKNIKESASTSSETEEETDLLNSFVSIKTKNGQNMNESLQKNISTDSDDDFTFSIN